MDPLKLLRDKARQTRDRAIYNVRAEYRETVRQLATLCRQLAAGEYTRLGNPMPTDFSLKGMPVVRAAAIILEQLQLLTIPEIVCEMQKRGCRSLDDPIRVSKTVRSSFRYHRGRFVRDAGGRWSVAGS
jgi:hypothetical protein